MAIVTTDNQNYTNIANSIREKTGAETTYKPAEMPQGISEVYDAGYSQHERDFWDGYMREGRSTIGMFAGSGWTEENFKPVRDFNINQNIFYNHNVSNGNPYDLVEHLKKFNVKITGVVNARQSFYFAQFTHLPELDMTMGVTVIYNTFNGMRSLTTIDKIILDDEGSIGFTSPFQYCQALKNITFEGAIGKSISFSDSPLSVESMKSIISCLKDYSETENEYTYTLTLKSDCVAALDAEGATSPNGNKWVEYVDDLKWNLVTA